MTICTTLSTNTPSQRRAKHSLHKQHVNSLQYPSLAMLKSYMQDLRKKKKWFHHAGA